HAAGALAHDRARAASEPLVAVGDLAQRLLPAAPAVELGAQRLDLRLDGVVRGAQLVKARLERAALLIQAEPELAQVGERGVVELDLAPELVGARPGARGLGGEPAAAPPQVGAPARRRAQRPLVAGEVRPRAA